MSRLVAKKAAWLRRDELPEVVDGLGCCLWLLPLVPEMISGQSISDSLPPPSLLWACRQPAGLLELLKAAVGQAASGLSQD